MLLVRSQTTCFNQFLEPVLWVWHGTESGQRVGKIKDGEHWAPASAVTSVSLRQRAEAEGARQKGSRAGLAEQHAFPQSQGNGMPLD